MNSKFYFSKKAPNPGLMPLPLHVQQSIQQTQLPNPFGPNVMVEVPPEDPLDPLAMPDPSLVNPMDVEIKTEVFDDEPMTMEGSMITDDPYAHPDEGDVSNLLISSVVSGNDQEFDIDNTNLEKSALKYSLRKVFKNETRMVNDWTRVDKDIQKSMFLYLMNTT